MTDRATRSLRILVVEDERLFALAVAKRLRREGHDCAVAGTIGEALEALEADAGAPPGRALDLMLLDERLPDGSGLDLLLGRREEDGLPPPPVVMMTAFGDIGHAVSAMKLGAADYLTKPVDLDRLAETVARVAAKPARAADADDDAAPAKDAEASGGFLGPSEAMQTVRARLDELGRIGFAGTVPPTVLVTGETGTGKDLAARLLHASGRSRNAPFVQVDCAALPRELFESELFGHERGAFTGAATRKTGLVESAGSGTLFLDEVGEVPLDTQAKLLAMLDRRTFRRLGSTREQKIGARIIAATNRDLQAMVAEGSFRSDLLYRLRVLSLALPPLRAHAGDIPALVAHFADQVARAYGREAPGIAPEALERLQAYGWPGNVRELKHLVEQLVLLQKEGSVQAADVEAALGRASLPAGGGDGALPQEMSLGELSLEDSEKRLIEAALARAGGNVSKAARLLKVSRMTLRYRIEKHGIQVGREALAASGED